MAPVAYGMASTEKIGAFLAERRNVVVAGIRRDGRPHRSPNWFYWDGERFYVSTTRRRVKYAIFRRDPQAQLLIDDSTGFRAVLVPATRGHPRGYRRGAAPLPRHPGKARGGGPRR
jgi:nitroimidazol reductase NimA-like FMN-containing flavoprotein (pyridoxamine 5'-phosphate oxidase superfamily)